MENPDIQPAIIADDILTPSARMCDLVRAYIEAYASPDVGSVPPAAPLTTGWVPVQREIVGHPEIDLDWLLAGSFGRRIGRACSATPTTFRLHRVEDETGHLYYALSVEYGDHGDLQ